MTNKEDNFRWLRFLYEYGADRIDEKPKDRYAFLKFVLFFIFLLGFGFAYGQMLPHEIKDPKIRNNFYEIELRRSYHKVDYGKADMTGQNGAVRVKLHVDYGDTAFYQAKASAYLDTARALKIYKVQKISGDSIRIMCFGAASGVNITADSATVFWETFAYNRGD